MKKLKKITLHKETLRRLTGARLETVVAGYFGSQKPDCTLDTCPRSCVRC